MTNLPDCPVWWLTYGNPKTVRKLGEQGNKAVLGWVMKEGLIPSRYECLKCKKDMLLVERKGTIDGFEWCCRVQSKENPHFVCRSVRKGMWFSHSRLSICVILRLTSCIYPLMDTTIIIVADVQELYRPCTYSPTSKTKIRTWRERANREVTPHQSPASKSTTQGVTSTNVRIVIPARPNRNDSTSLVSFEDVT
ncbi:uncharacterized protein TNCV_2597161 [Trichonephila clavipes]|nr:uncharacterized protein TNCV_2597161 [Trichonephila clavipes]